MNEKMKGQEMSTYVEMPLAGMATLAQLKELFGCTEKTVVSVAGAGRLAAVEYDRANDVLTLRGEYGEGEA